MKYLRRLAVVLTCLFLLSGCAWTDKLLLMSRAAKAWTSLQSLEMDVQLKTEGNLSQKIIQLPFVLNAEGTMEITKQPRTFVSHMRVSGGNDLFQIPLDLDQQWQQSEQGWQHYDMIRKQWTDCDEPFFNPFLDLDKKEMAAFMESGELSWIKETDGNKKAVISFILQPDQVNAFLSSLSSEPAFLTLFKSLGEVRMSIRMDLKTGQMEQLTLNSLSTLPQEKTAGFEAVLEQFSLDVRIREWNQ